MVAPKRQCEAISEGGEQCRAQPMRDANFCFWHDPATRQDATEARRLGGMRRRREATVAGAYELDGLSDVGGLRRVLDIVTADMLSLENTIARGRVLLAVVQSGARLLEVGAFEERLAALEAKLRSDLPGKRAS